MTTRRYAHLDARMPPAPVETSSPTATNAQGKLARAPSREGKVGIMVWVRDETRDELHQLARKEKKSLSALMIEALNLLARSRGLHPFNEGTNTHHG